MKTDSLTLTQRILFVLTLVIILVILGSALDIFSQSRQEEHSKTLVNHYVQSVTRASSSQIGDFIDKEDSESLTTFAQELSKDTAITQVKVYSIQGVLLADSQLKAELTGSNPSNSVQQINDIYFSDKQVGFLALSFDDNYLQDFYLLDPQVNRSSLFTALLSSGLLIIVIFLGISRRKFVSPLIPLFPEESKHLKSPSDIFKAIVEQNKSKKELLKQETLIVIQADWLLEKKREQTKLLRFFKNWLANTHWHVSSFSDGLLHISTGNYNQRQMLTKVRMLDIALSQQSIQPTILIHTIDIEQPVYQQFFEVISPGIWTESVIHTSQDKEESTEPSAVLSLEHELDETLDIDIEGIGEVSLVRIKQPTSQELKFIKKQVARLRK